MKNFTKLFVIMYFLSGFVVNSVKQPLNSNNFDQEITTIQYKIRSGDTLWDIADNFNPSNKENFINELMIINNLDSYLLEVNKILVRSNYNKYYIWYVLIVISKKQML